MRATRFEYRFRFILHAIIFIVGFYSPWVNRNTLTAKSTWVTFATYFAEHQWLTFFAAVKVLLAIALLFVALGAWFRVWGTAYVSAGVVGARDMHGDHLLADGPYLHTRNPLYLGSLLHTIGISILMPPTGALFTIALIWILQVRLALAEEPFLTERFGQEYVQYKQRVPRFLPMIAPQWRASGQVPQWGQAILGELYFVLVVLVMGTFGWTFNAQPLLRGILISLGLWIVVRAFLPGPKKD